MLIELQAPIETQMLEYIPLVFLSSPSVGVSAYLDNQFPQFVKEDHQRFITFVKSYYEWMESDNGVLNSAKKLKLYQDIDYTQEPYTEQFFREFLSNFPRTLATNPDTLLKNIRDFYRAKGTEKSFELFFRAVYGLNPEFYYPRVDILKVSDGKWIQQKSLRVFSSIGNPLNLKSQRIRGSDSNCTAYVEKVFLITEGNYSGFELSLNRSSITGNFLPEETLISDDGTIQVTVSAAPSVVTIRNSGANYSVGDLFEINVVGNGAKIQVQSINSTGGILSFKIINYGLGYKSYFPLENYLISDKGAVIDISYDSLITYPGYYLNEDGQISTFKYLQDGEYYQAFSYVVYVNESFSTYKDAVNKVLHPAGLRLFGGFRTQNLVDAKVHVASDTSSTYVAISNNGIPVSAAIKSITNLVNRISTLSASSLGSTNTSINFNKFNYKPVSKYDANQEILGVPNYFGIYGDLSSQKAITPISAFDELNIKLSDLIDNPIGKTNIMPDAVVLTETAITPP